MPDGRVDVKGQVVESDPTRKLVVTWNIGWIEELKKLPEAIVTYGDRADGRSRAAHHDRIPSDTNSGPYAGRGTARLAGHSLRVEIAPRNRTRSKNSDTASAK